MVIFIKIFFGIFIFVKYNGNEEELFFVINNNDVVERNYFYLIYGFIFI